ncbi:peptidoglycan DD-metalloendopeptidase family protein [Tsuneonella mangrovi]|uniref:peptidoglycan DD-metalloendopeptidase family protein n=1 Tax=Tsuneonella mangrovi TaxID=1982042 RepID=UPI001F0AA5DB|nr:peptidoglycan DD-metalloendopeptidase family protein [Tsuneonella mangrovi]
MFPDREFFMRSQGQVRFIKVSSRIQMVAAALVVGALLVWGVTLAGMAWSQYRAQADRASLLDREARVATAQERVDAYRDNIKSVESDLKRRQTFLEEMVDSLPADVKTKGDTVTDSSSEAAKTVSKVSASIPEAGALARIEARQLAFVERLTRYADMRANRAADAIRKLGLDPKAMVRAEQHMAMGGPLEALSTSSDGSIDPRFERLGLSLARMEALERGLQGIPQVLPASVEMVTSSYGVRRDPFTGRPAFHPGLDFRGPRGAPIYAAAKGKVIFVGQIRGYGNIVEISHGNGLVTRYAHMSKFHAHVGERVKAGEVIGAIGSTGRSTGPHLHFEVRINGRAVNPRPFLETAPDVLKEARRNDTGEPTNG